MTTPIPANLSTMAKFFKEKVDDYLKHKSVIGDSVLWGKWQDIGREFRWVILRDLGVHFKKWYGALFLSDLDSDQRV